MERALANPELRNVYFDISWDEVAKYWSRVPRRSQATAALINKYPDRFLFGTDEVAPTDQTKYLKIYDMYAPLLAELTPEAQREVAQGELRAALRRGQAQSTGLGKGNST